MKHSLNLRYQLANIFYYGVLAVMLAFISNFLLNLGYSNSVIGLVMSIYSIICVFGQPAMADFAERHPSLPIQKIVTMTMFLTAALSALLYIAGLVLGKNIIILILVVIIFAAAQCVMPMFNTMAFIYEKDGITINFGFARGLGSASYAIVSMGLGYVIALLTPSVLPLFYVLFTVLCGLAVSSYVLKDHKETETEQKSHREKSKITFTAFTVRYTRFILFLTGFMLMYTDHMLINNFYIQVIQSVGGTASDMGIAIFIAAMLELPAMFSITLLIQRYGTANLLKTASVFFIVKHVITWLAGSMPMIYLAAAFQAGAYALFIPCAVYYVNEIIAPDDQLMGQSVNGMFLTLGSVLASLIGGMLLDLVGVKTALLIGVIISAVGAILVFANLQKPLKS